MKFTAEPFYDEVIVNGIPYKMTKKNAVFLFRKMWTEMEDYCINSFYYDLMDQSMLDEAKRCWIVDNLCEESDAYMRKHCDCFLCAYDDSRNGFCCSNCPIDWGTDFEGHNYRCVDWQGALIDGEISFEDFANFKEREDVK